MNIISIIFGGIATFATVLGLHVWLMKLVIDNAVSKTLLSIQKCYVDKEAFERHVDNKNAHK